MHRRLFFGGMLACLLVLPAVTQASEDDVQREKRAAHAYSSANELSERFGHYAQAREAFLTGDGSVRGHVEAWQRDASTWVGGWLEALAVAGLEADESYADFETKLTTILRRQAETLVSLNERATRITREGNAAVEQLAATAADYPGLDGQAAVIQGLTQREAELRTAVTEIEALPTSKLATFGEIDALTRRAVMARVRAALLANAKYPLEQTVASVQALLDAEAVVDPFLVRLLHAESELGRYALNFQVFHAEDAVVPARALCADAKAKLAALPQTSFVVSSKHRADDLCAAIEEHAASFADLGVSKADMVQQYLSVEKAGLAALCKSTHAAPSCERLAALAGFSAAGLKRLSEGELKLVELGWQSAMDAAKRREGVL